MVQHMDAEKTQNKRILVGMGEFAVSHNPHTLSCIGLGSCIGVALYDRISHMGGLAHIMLPDSEEPESKISNPLKHADLGIEAMLKELLKKDNGINTTGITAKIAGGAHMFPTMDKSSSMDIGKRNAECVKKKLKSLGIKLLAEDTGGTHGRTMNFDLTTGIVSIYIHQQETIEL